MAEMKVTEKMLEDWICENPRDLFYGIDVIERQIQLVHGRLDILAYTPFGIAAIELKRGALKEKDVGQVLRYVNDINLVLSDLWTDSSGDEDDYENTNEVVNNLADVLNSIRHGEPHTLTREICIDLVKSPPKCFPFLIGESIDAKTYASANGAGAMILLWYYDEEVKTFRTHPSQAEMDNHAIITRHYPNWVSKVIGKHISSVYDKTNDIFEIGLERLFNL